MKKELLKNVKGMRDFSFEDMLIREKMISVIVKYFKLFGFLPIETPTLEYYDLLMDKYGSESDKLIYNFKDKADRHLGMIYDLTVPLSRYVAQNYNSIKFPFKRYQIQRVYRYENTQRGRFREFYQCDIDTIGSSSGSVEVEMFVVISLILNELKLNDFQIQVNFRSMLDEFLASNGVKEKEKRELFLKAIDKLDKMPKEKVVDYLKENKFGYDGNDLIEKLKGMKTPDRFYEIQKMYSKFSDEKSIVFNPMLARGLAYYTDTVFEIVLPSENMGSIGGGGRYDSLIETLIDVKIPACGFAFGFERMFEIMKQKGGFTDNAIEYMIINSSNTEVELSVQKVLIDAQKSVLYYPDARKYSVQFKYADDMNIKNVLILGEDEMKKGCITVKDLKQKTQRTLKVEEFKKELK